MDDKIIYWLWLQACLGAGAKVKKLLDEFKSAEEFYFSGESVWRDKITSPLARERMQKKSPTDFLETVNFCKKYKIHILCPNSEFYPERLLEIENYPLALYVRGDYKILKNDRVVAVIGSRTPCVYGQKAAEKIVQPLVENGYLIVSGGALGIDSVAHKSAIEYGGKTLLIMGCGHGDSYLSENSNLRKLVANNGALISEYPPLTPVAPGSFPLRNRIISALSKGVVIVEAADPSGTFNTANHALDQNRDIFVLPGDIESGNFAGSNKLITEGATPVFSGEDVLAYYGEAPCVKNGHREKNGKAFADIDVDSDYSKKSSKNFKKKSKARSEKSVSADYKESSTEKGKKNGKKCPEGISKNASIVYNIMSADTAAVDDIARKSGLDIRKVLVALTELEMVDAAENNGPGKYRLK